MYCGAGDGSDFWVVIDQGRANTVFTAHFGQQVCTERAEEIFTFVNKMSRVLINLRCYRLTVRPAMTPPQTCSR